MSKITNDITRTRMATVGVKRVNWSVKMRAYL